MIIWIICRVNISFFMNIIRYSLFVSRLYYVTTYVIRAVHNYFELIVINDPLAIIFYTNGCFYN